MKINKQAFSIQIPVVLANYIANKHQFDSTQLSATEYNACNCIMAYLMNQTFYNVDQHEIHDFVNISRNQFQTLAGVSHDLISNIITGENSYLSRWFCDINHAYSNNPSKTKGNQAFSKAYRLKEEIILLMMNEHCEKSDFTFALANKGIEMLTGGAVKSVKEFKKLKITSRCDVPANADMSIENIDSRFSDPSIYAGERTDMNSWEKKIAKRMKHIWVDIGHLASFEGNDIKKLHWIGRVIKAGNSDSVTFKHGRLYRCPFFHNLPSEYRDACRWDDEKLAELIDVKNCFAQLAIKIFQNMNINKDEFVKYRQTVKNGIYDAIVEKYNKCFTRTQIKRAFCKYYFCNSAEKKRLHNTKLSSYICNKALRPEIAVAHYFIDEFPEISTCLEKYREYGTGRGAKSAFSVDCQWIENDIVLNKLAQWVEDIYKIRIVTLHDSIWCKYDDAHKADVTAIENKLNELI